MPMNSITLVPGVNTERTLSLNQAGVSQSQLIRYKDGLIQAYGGCVNYVSFTIPSTVRDLHAWLDVQGVKHLGVGATANLLAITNGSNQDITPQTNTTNNPPSMSVSSGSNIVTIVDGNSSASVFDTVFFNTPVALGPLLLNGAYQITSALGTSIYTIQSSATSSATVNSSGILPIFNATGNSASVTVTLPNNNFKSITGLFYDFNAATSVGGLTIQGPYQISSVVDSTNFTINAATQASSTATATMNGGNAQLLYYITIGPQATASGFGAGGFGSGGFGTGTATSGGSGTPITATDWSLDNWGEVLLACPANGPIYAWSPASGFQNAQVIAQAPFANGGIFVSMPQQILVAWRSVLSTGAQDNLIIRWSNSGDYTNWAVTSQTTAGSFHLPTGSIIVGGLQAPNQGVIWTDIEVWVMRYVGGDVIFNFTRVGQGCGLIGQHAAGVLGGNVYWCSYNNFYILGDGGVQVIPCSVWDQIFQNLNTTYQSKIVCAPNSTFNEITWFYPSATSAGENDSYVKFNVTENAWDYGTLPRTAWTDISILGNPIGADQTGQIYQQEMGTVTAGVAASSFQTGWWSISDGNDFAFVDWVIPDFIWGLRSGSATTQMTLTFYTADYPGDTPRAYGPYTVSQNTEFINTRMRGRLMSVFVQDFNSGFYRLGRIRYRWAPAGRR